MINAIFYIILALTIIIEFLFMPIPIGNENTTVRRLPYVTFSLIGVNILIFVVTLPAMKGQTRDLVEAAGDFEHFLIDHPEVMRDSAKLQSLVDAGVISREQAEQFKKSAYLEGERPSAETPSEPDSPDIPDLALTQNLRAQQDEIDAEFDAGMARFKKARDAHIWFRFGIAPNGTWKFFQPLTSAFIHEGWLHVLGNMLFLFAVAFSLEDLWGRSVFLAFYLVGAVVAALPMLISPIVGPCFGASGAVSAVMGAFLVRLYKTKIKVFWISLPFLFTLLLRWIKPFGVVRIAAYIYLPFYFITQALHWWLVAGTQRQSGVAYSVHVTGFLFGAAFALVLKASKIEERVLHPAIESKISFSGSKEVSDAMELIDGGDLTGAQRKLQSALSRNPDDVDALMGLIQVHQRTGEYHNLNSLYGRVIRHHLAHGDKEAALYAYDALLCSFPEGQGAPTEGVRIPVRDWFTICEYLRSSGMTREASVEFERLAAASTDTPLAARACVQGAEAALATNDYGRALKLFQFGATLNPPSALATRIEGAIADCQEKIAGLPAWDRPRDGA